MKTISDDPSRPAPNSLPAASIIARYTRQATSGDTPPAAVPAAIIQLVGFRGARLCVWGSMVEDWGSSTDRRYADNSFTVHLDATYKYMPL